MSLTPDIIISHIVGVVSGLFIAVLANRTILHELRYHVKSHCREIEEHEESRQKDVQRLHERITSVSKVANDRLRDHGDRIRKLENEDSYRRGREGR